MLKSLPHKHVIFPGGNELNRKKARFNGRMLSGTIEFWSAVSHSQPQERVCLHLHLSRVYLHQVTSTFSDLLYKLNEMNHDSPTNPLIHHALILKLYRQTEKQ